MGKSTLILGGARSGKSTFAQNLARQSSGPVLYLATAEPLDEEMAARIATHRLDRPADWQTLEIPRGIGKTLCLQPLEAGLVVLDCLTLLVTNLVLAACPDLDHPDEPAAAQNVNTEIKDLLAFISTNSADWIIVSNEVGLGLVPPYPVGRLYRDLLGWANQRLAAQVEEVYWMVAGIPVPIHHFRQDAAVTPPA